MPPWQLSNYVLSVLFSAAVTLLLVLTILAVFKVKSPTTRLIFLFIPLVKPFVVLMDSASSTASLKSKVFGFGMRMPDPLDMISSPWAESSSFTYSSSIFGIAITIVIFAVALVIVGRWAQLFLFLNSFKKERRLSKVKYPQLYETLGRLAEKFNVKQPELVVSKNFLFVPFSVGSITPIIVVSTELLESFTHEQLEIMLAHELAHIRRRDNFTGWFSLILRDLMFFNPLAYKIYGKIEEEKELICDRIAHEETGISTKAIANTLLDIALFRKSIDGIQKPMFPELAKGFLYKKSTLERRVNSIMDYKPIRSCKTLIPFRVLAVTFLLLIQPYIYFGIGGHLFMLR